MTDFAKSFGLGPSVGRLQEDVESSLARQKKSTLSEAASYEPGDALQWADPPPTTIAEALDRLAKAGATSNWPA